MSGSTRLNVGVGWLHEIDKATCMDDLRLANCERPRGDRQSRVPKKDLRERKTTRKENSSAVDRVSSSSTSSGRSTTYKYKLSVSAVVLTQMCAATT